ncbi:MAG: TolC family protein [Bernardetiaceae bacterium]
MQRSFSLLIFFCCVFWTDVVAQSDSVLILRHADFFQWIRQHHPFARRAQILDEQARQFLRESRGGFDPKLFADRDNKFYEGTNYFDILRAGLKVPTWWGIELKAQYEQAEGVYLGRERTVPENGLGVVGISVPVAQGLLMDERRAVLRQAQIFEQSNTAEQLNQLNDLIFDAAQSYAEWVMLYYQKEVFQEAVDLADERLQGIIESYRQGDLAAMDTLEALIQLQDRQLNLQEASLQFLNQTLDLNNFFWEDNQPLQLAANFKPQDLDTLLSPIPYSLNEFQNRMDTWRESHPLLQQYRFKLASLDIERRLKAEKLKPKINLEYNFLTGKDTFAPEGQMTLTPANYKWGLNFSFPIFLREARGGLGLTRVKIAQTEFEFSMKEQELFNKWQSYFNELQTLRQQIDLYTETTANYRQLTAAEITRFRNGESSLFLINARESKQIEAENKLISLKAKYFKTWMALYWIGGELANFFDL